MGNGTSSNFKTMDLNDRADMRNQYTPGGGNGSYGDANDQNALTITKTLDSVM